MYTENEQYLINGYLKRLEDDLETGRIPIIDYINEKNRVETIVERQGDLNEIFV